MLSEHILQLQFKDILMGDNSANYEDGQALFIYLQKKWEQVCSAGGNDQIWL